MKKVSEQQNSSVILFIADKGYGIPEIKNELTARKFSDGVTVVSGENGIDSLVASVLENSLFGATIPKLVIVETAEERDALISAIMKSNNTNQVFIVLRSTTEIQKKKYESFGWKVILFPPSPKKDEKDSGEAFALARLIAGGDIKNSWLMWKDMESRRVAIDSVIPAIWWQLKKSYSFSRSASEKNNLRETMRLLIDSVHESRQGISSLSKMFEHQLLNLKK